MANQVSAYIDAANLSRGADTLGIKVDYQKLRTLIIGDRLPIAFYFYDCTQNKPGESKYFEKIKSFGYNLKLTKIHTYNGQELKQKKTDTQMVADSIIDGIVIKRMDIAVFCTGDKDILPAMEYLLNYGVKVEIMSFEHCLAWDLKKCGATIINLTSIKDQIKR